MVACVQLKAFYRLSPPVFSDVYTGRILAKDEAAGIYGTGHNSVVNAQGTDDWYIVYHRRPIPNQDRDHRVTCIDRLEFDAEGLMKRRDMSANDVPIDESERRYG